MHATRCIKEAVANLAIRGEKEQVRDVMVVRPTIVVPALDFEVSRVLEKQLQAIHGTPTVLESWILLLNGTDELLQLVISWHLHFCARIIAQSRRAKRSQVQRCPGVKPKMIWSTLFDPRVRVHAK
jgi:hypothetical protein